MTSQTARRPRPGRRPGLAPPAGLGGVAEPGAPAEAEPGAPAAVVDRAREQIVPASHVRGSIVLADNLTVLQAMAERSVDLVYVDPPFNTGKTQALQRLEVTHAPDGERVGYGGRRYRTTRLGRLSYADVHEDYLAFLEPRLVEIHRVLAVTGTLYFHIDYREAHYCKILLDEIFGRECFLNEIIWAYDFGARATRRWPPKHDTILVYVKDRRRYYFDAAAVDREPYMAPGLVGPEKAARGKLPTDTWWHTIVPTSGKERTGYPTQKPLGILRRIVGASCPPGGLVADVFAGSGTTGAACLELGRRFLLVDDNPAAVGVMHRRFVGAAGIIYEPAPPNEAPHPGATDASPADPDTVGERTR